MIRFEQFGWRFAEAPCWALRDIVLTIDRGEFVVIAGPSGSGKSTLAMAMCGLLLGRQEGEGRGRVLVDGDDVAGIPLYQTAEKIALVQQNPETHFATLTVADEIAFGMENRCLDRAEIERRSAEAMQWLGISHLRGRALATLSGGEKQRVAVASILAGGPAVVVLDEPTASLDPESSTALFRRLAVLCRRQGLTVVVTEHKLALLRRLGSRVVFLDAGCVVADERWSTSDDDRQDEGAWKLGLAGRQPCPLSDPTGEPVARLSQVHVTPGDAEILTQVSLCVQPGEIVALTGPNGGGKSTLLQCMAGLVGPSRGAVEVCGSSVVSPPSAALVRRIGFVFQNADHQIVSDTVWGEALFASRQFGVADATVEEEARRFLAGAGLAGRRQDHPYRLSWGEKRRLNVVSAILHRPRLLLLDEPFAGQDWENLGVLLGAIRRVVEDVHAGNEPDAPNSLLKNVAAAPCGGRRALKNADAEGQRRVLQQPAKAGSPGPGACVLVTHDPRIVTRFCSRVVFVADGRIIVDSAVAEAFNRLRSLGHGAYVADPQDPWSAIAGRVDRGPRAILGAAAGAG